MTFLRRGGQKPIHAYGGIEHTQPGPFADCLLCRIEALSETITVERDMRPVREKRVAWEAWKAAVGPELESDRGEFEKWWSTDTPADSQEDKT